MARCSGDGATMCHRLGVGFELFLKDWGINHRFTYSALKT